MYSSSTYLDDMMLAAAWMAVATGDAAYTTDAVTYFTRITAAPDAYRTSTYSWDNQYWAACLLMWEITRQSGYAQEVRAQPS